MQMIEAKSAPTMKNPHEVKACRLYDKPGAQAIHLTLEPGQSLKRHLTPVDVFFYVLEGKGIVEIGGERQEVGPDVLIDSPARVPHCWYNESDGPLRVLVVKTPRPTESTRLL